MVESLQNSLEYYEQLKMMEDMLKEGTTVEVNIHGNTYNQRYLSPSKFPSFPFSRDRKRCLFLAK